MPGYPNNRTVANDLLLRGDRLYYIGSYEAGCLDAASGNVLWQRWFVKRKSVESNGFNDGDDLNLLLSNFGAEGDN